MSYLRRIDGLIVDADEVGASFRGSDSRDIRSNVWVFTEGLIVTPASAFNPHKPIRPLQHLDLDILEPSSIVAAYARAVDLRRDRVAAITLRGGGSWFNPHKAYVHLSDTSVFWLEMPLDLAEATVSVLRDIYPGLVDDHRDLG
jgi:hypothetical protein